MADVAYLGKREITWRWLNNYNPVIFMPGGRKTECSTSSALWEFHVILRIQHWRTRHDSSGSITRHEPV